MVFESSMINIFVPGRALTRFFLRLSTLLDSSSALSVRPDDKEERILSNILKPTPNLWR